MMRGLVIDARIFVLGTFRQLCQGLEAQVHSWTGCPRDDCLVSNHSALHPAIWVCPDCPFPGKSVDGEKRLVEMSLRTNAKPKTTSFTLGDLQEGQVVDGVVKRIERYGIFIRIAGSNLSGLCHKSEVRALE
jgi:RecJ-like exonuclease